MTDDKDVEALENRIDELETTIQRMLPNRREVIGMAGAGLAGAGLMSGTASAGSNQVGSIGSDSKRVDIEAEDIDLTNQPQTPGTPESGQVRFYAKNGEPFFLDDAGNESAVSGGPVLESGDTITVATISDSTVDQTFEVLYSGTAKDVLGGTVSGTIETDFLYTFSDSTTLRKNGTGTSYTRNNSSFSADAAADDQETDFLPPAKDVTQIEVGAANFSSGTLGAEVILRD